MSVMHPYRPMQEVLSEWAEEVAAKVGRSADDIRTRGIGATDFSPLKSIEIRYPGGMVVQIPFAFVVFRREQSVAAVFSEHAGYMEFVLPEETTVIEITQSPYHQE
ncbi:MAG: hypothetical protein KA144_03300 [Xanthomonadaceae bacterium]|nr:hypothetical protein [Xanthomonadaceae bacterium]MCC7249445.1 hypothetical protein [Lysobacter sp.]